MSRDVSAEMIDMCDLPDGWRLKPLKQVTRPSKVKVDPRQCPYKPYLSLEHIEAETTKILGRGTASDVRSTKAVFNAGDVLYGRLRPYLNKVARPDFDGVASTDILVFPPQQELDQRYLLRFLNSATVVDHAHHHSMGLQMPRIGFEVLGDIPIPLPPIHIQEQIADILESLIDQVDAARDRLATIPALLKKFRQAVLAAACSGQLTADWRKQTQVSKPTRSVAEQALTSNGKTRRGVNLDAEISEELLELNLPGSWELATVSTLLAAGVLIDVKDGNHGANHPKASEYSSAGLPFIMANHVSKGKVDYENAPKLEGLALSRIRVGMSFVGDVILTHKGSVGRVAIATADSILTPQTTYYRCNTAILQPAYLAIYLESLFYYNQVAQTMSQTTRDFVPISEQYLKTVILPPSQEQAEIVRRVESLFALADSIESRLAEATVQVERTTQAILAKAFRGEL